MKQNKYQEIVDRFVITGNDNGVVTYKGDFSAWFLKNLSENSRKFITDYNNIEMFGEDGRKSVKVCLLEDVNLSEIAGKVRDGVKDVYIWEEKNHWKSQDENQNKIYHNDDIYRFYHKPAGMSISIRESRHPFDFKNRLITTGLTLFMVVTVTDLKGHYKHQE